VALLAVAVIAATGEGCDGGAPVEIVRAA
jgi:hypothetical protein